jgi:tetratricopeptide (TPR) repeat protein
MIDIPLGLRTAIESGNCILFIGAGLGDHIIDEAGNPAPDSKTLAKDLAQEFSIDVHSEYDLAQIASVIELRFGRADLISFLQRRLTNLSPDEAFQWLFTIRWSGIFTTNYDDVIERAYELIPKPPQNPIPISIASQLVDHDPRFEVPIYHIHGSLFGPGNKKIIITEDDYSKYQEPRRMLFELLKTKFATSPVLYIGYSNRDPNWRTLINEISSEFYPEEIPQSYRISPHTDEIEDEILRSKNIFSIEATYQEFFEIASSNISGAQQDSNRYTKLKKNIPSDLLPYFEENPAPVARLISSWDYVTQEVFHEKPNIHSFLRGNRPNWSLVGDRNVFERDIEEEIFEHFLDFFTSPSDNPRISIILGSAGYGTTTLLMTLAARLVNDKLGSVYMLRPGNRIKEGDIEFAVSIARDRPFFFIDNAADYPEEIHTIYARLRDSKKPAYMILGDRLNEWRQSHGRLNIQEFVLNPLSDPEIHRLIDLLEEKSELGVLSDLNRDMQFSAIKEIHNKELLVTLREVTEGKSFDAILEDEYRGISPQIARNLYLAVCCFHQSGVFVRDNLLSKILDISLVDLYDVTSKSTEGVIHYENIDKTREEYAARSRHRIIAKVVWERCSLPGERDELLRSSLSALNLNYGLDKSAFEEFIRSDHTIDQIQTLEGKIKFFETAAKKDPESPYVRQHYARMLLREEKFDLALAQINQAIELSPRNRVLHHTKGTILKTLAFSTENIQISRRRLIQSEDSFNYCLSLYGRDEYSYQGLAQLYRGWAKRAPTIEETTEYLTKAEEIINQGLKKVKSRAALWIESSKIQSFLGDEPSRLKALEKAVSDSPGSVIARYLLGRAYRVSQNYKKAIEVLEPVVKNHHEEFRCFVEYALSLSITQKNYDEAIATLRLSRLYGLSDPRYIATLGGMLIMSGKISDGQDIFQESLKQNFNSDELHKIQFRPWNFSNPNKELRLNGTVIVRKAGYALVESEGYPPFLTPGFRFDGVAMEQGQNVSFTPAFCAKGSLALEPKIL